MYMRARAHAAALAGSLALATVAVAQTSNPEIADPSMNQWLRNQHGAITKQQYMDEAGRRWDAMDTRHSGLTADQINRMYSGAPTPNMVKKGNNMTNPTGTELKGESGGGK